jgi:hypothetical protein
MEIVVGGRLVDRAPSSGWRPPSTVEAALASVLSLFFPKDGAVPSYGVVTVAAVGVVLSAVWWLQLRSYRDLNAAKFRVILRIEERLAAQPFALEWAELSKDKVTGWRGRYAELGFSARFVPLLFAIVYVVLATFRSDVPTSR